VLLSTTKIIRRGNQAPTSRRVRRAGTRAAESARRRPSVREANIGKILTATEPVFAHMGYAGASMTKLAQAACMPKANLHYYFGTKEQLFRTVLEGIIGRWLEDAAVWIVPQRHPRDALSSYVRAKMAMTRQRPDASRIFAAELLCGAPHIGGYLTGELRRCVARLSKVIAGWSERGLMDAVNPQHLLFDIWAMTQTYADFDVQVMAVLGKRRLSERDFRAATDTIVTLVLKGCGIRRSSCPC
jgi:TetR/AcrR family transcriptional regulator